jgi:hypothetical protein
MSLENTFLINFKYFLLSRNICLCAKSYIFTIYHIIIINYLYHYLKLFIIYYFTLLYEDDIWMIFENNPKYCSRFVIYLSQGVCHKVRTMLATTCHFQDDEKVTAYSNWWQEVLISSTHPHECFYVPKYILRYGLLNQIHLSINIFDTAFTYDFAVFQRKVNR